MARKQATPRRPRTTPARGKPPARGGSGGPAAHGSADKALVTLRGIAPSLNPAERKVADFILKNASQAVGVTVSEVAQGAGVSEATVVRLCRTLGYRGYQDFKIALARELVSPVTRIAGDIDVDDSPAVITEKVFRANMQTLEDTLSVLDMRAMAQAGRLLQRAERIMITGVGTSAAIAQDAYTKLMRLNLPCLVETDAHLAIMHAALLDRRAVVLAISHSGSTLDPIEALEVAQDEGAKTIVITNNARSPITTAADVVLVTASAETRYRHEALASRIAQTSIINALFMILSLADLAQTEDAMTRIEEAIAVKQI